MRLPVSLLIWLKLIFSRSLVAGNSWMGQDTRERRRKPFQYARGAMGRSYTTPAEQVIRTMYLLRAYITPVPRRMCSQSVPETKSEPPPRRRRRGTQARGGAYLSWVEMVSNLELRLEPIAFTLAMMTIEMPAAIRPYSIAVAPDSSFRNAKTLDMRHTPCGPMQRQDSGMPLTTLSRGHRIAVRRFFK